MPPKRVSDPEDSSSTSEKRPRTSECLSSASLESSQGPDESSTSHLGNEEPENNQKLENNQEPDNDQEPDDNQVSGHSSPDWSGGNANPGITVWIHSDEEDEEAARRQNEDTVEDWNRTRRSDGLEYTVDTGTDGEVTETRLKTWDELPLDEKIKQARIAVAREPERINASTLYVRRLEKVKEMVNVLARLPRDRPWMSFDLEARGLGHDSKLALMQIRDHQQNMTYLVDTLVMEDEEVWDVAADDGTTLRQIFEDENRAKLAWDTRQDSCCLYGQLQIKVRGLIDVQILHLFIKTGPSELRQNLKTGVSDMAGLDTRFAAWEADKKALDKLGARHDWLRRPLLYQQKKYAAADVENLYTMYSNAEQWLTEKGMACGKDFSRREVESTWTTKEEWDKAKKELRFNAGIRDEFLTYWQDTTEPLRRPGAPLIGPSMAVQDTGDAFDN